MSGASAMVWCPFPDLDSARACAKTVLEETLAACANMLPGVQSMFVWDGNLNEANEVGVLFKSRVDLLELLIDRIGQLHPYDQPAIVGWRCDQSHTATLEWLATLPASDSLKK